MAAALTVLVTGGAGYVGSFTVRRSNKLVMRWSSSTTCGKGIAQPSAFPWLSVS